MGEKTELPKIKTRFEVKNEANSDAAELYLYGQIRQACWWDDEDEEVISAKAVRAALKNLKGKDINIHISSNGGDVFESIAICNLLKQHDGKINVYIDGVAASGASIIATAGEQVFMFPNSMQMIHKAWTFAAGNADELRKVATDLDKIDSSVTASYMNKFVGTEDELKQLLEEETFLTAEECKTFGLCSEIIEEPAKALEPEPEPSASIKESLFAKYKKQIEADKEAANKKAALFNAFKNKE